jgi:hypothetical protein
MSQRCGVYKKVASPTTTRPVKRGKIDTDSRQKLTDLFIFGALNGLGFYLAGRLDRLRLELSYMKRSGALTSSL